MRLSRSGIRALALGGAAAFCAGCVPATEPLAPKAAPSDLDRIEYSIGPCRGSCPVYSFSIAADGIAFFEGERHTRVAGRVPVDGGPALFQRLKARLAPLRPDADRSISHDACVAYATDQQTVTVAWNWGAGRRRTLSYDLGCGEERYAPLRRALSELRRELPIDALVGRATEF